MVYASRFVVAFHPEALAMDLAGCVWLFNDEYGSGHFLEMRTWFPGRPFCSMLLSPNVLHPLP